LRQDARIERNDGLLVEFYSPALLRSARRASTLGNLNFPGLASPPFPSMYNASDLPGGIPCVAVSF
jgi:hypothetical protein